MAWERALSEVEVELDGAGQEAPSAEAVATSLQQELAPLIAISPPSAVMESFVRVEKALRELIEQSVDLPPQEFARTQGAGGVRLARLAHDRHLITDETLSAIQGLAVLRNMAAHGHIPENMSKERALEYVTLADAVLFAIHQAGETT